jgi:DNA polymerase III epsilon subunit-like protein
LLRGHHSRRCSSTALPFHRFSTRIGITHDHALAHGVPLQYAIANFLADTNQSAIRIVAHNIQFDARIIGVEAQRAGLQFSFEGAFYLLHDDEYRKSLLHT